MHIVILNGSPKGQRSGTLRYSAYVAQQVPGHTYEILDVAARVRGLDRDPAAFDAVIDAVRRADLVLWSFPVYVLLVAAQYKRFIELVFERGAEDAFEGRPAALFSTSIRYFDCTAHDYMRSVCEDLGMSVMGAYSAGMHDLHEADERERLVSFFRQVFEDVEAGRPGEARMSMPLPPARPTYEPGPAATPVDSGGRKIVVVADTLEPGSSLAAMVERFCSSFDERPEVVELDATRIKSGCIGCLRCGLKNECRWEGKDEFIDMYRETIMTADVLVFAGEVRDRFLSSLWKTYFDRAFFNTHTPSIGRTQLGLLVSGPVRQLPHLRQFFDGYAQWQGANLVDVVTDEPSSPASIDSAIDALALRLARGAEAGYVRPRTFLGVGGWKIFRDDIWGKLRFIFRADYTAFKELGVYDFPQKDLTSRARNVVMGAVQAIPPARREYQKNLTRHMVADLDKLLAEGGGAQAIEPGAACNVGGPEPAADAA